MRRGSIRRPVVLYALVVVVALFISMVTVASFGFLRVARRAAFASAEQEALEIARGPDPVAEALRRRARGRLVGVIRPREQDLGVSFQQALDSGPAGQNGSWVARRVPDTDVFVVVFLEPMAAFRAARAEIRQLFVVGLAMSLLAALVLASFIIRLVLQPITALERVAADVSHGLDLDQAGAPHEVAEVAQTFQRTLRQLKRERAEIERQHLELERMQQSLIRSEKLASVGRLAAGVAHEIGNPLAAVLGYLSLLKRGLDEQATMDVIERSSKELRRIHETIKKLLTYARQDETGPVEQLDLKPVLADAALLLRGHPALSGVLFETSFDLEPSDVLGRAGPIGQIVVNLVVNAAQAVREGGGADPKVWLTMFRQDDGIWVEVADNGPGVPRDKREQIFDPFYTTKPPGEGTGLGLAVSRALAESMGADLTVGEASQGGARFVLKLRTPAGNPALTELG